MIKFLRNSFMQYKKRKIQIEMRNKYKGVVNFMGFLRQAKTKHFNYNF